MSQRALKPGNTVYSPAGSFATRRADLHNKGGSAVVCTKLFLLKGQLVFIQKLLGNGIITYFCFALKFHAI